MATATIGTKKDLSEALVYEAIFGGEAEAGEREESPDMEELLKVLRQFADSADQRGLRVKLTISTML